MSGREACRILAQHGFVEVRRRGSHVVMQKRTGTSTITVPVPDHSAVWPAADTLRDRVARFGFSGIPSVLGTRFKT
ncbi:MAG TPA: type II toxin-antitoxin system HicA family toxin [Thermoanaerobaculia bacterium]|nr:type II toxin-antitoxin system HicA family toxin [Thermoanaerobaculia bacterium]